MALHNLPTLKGITRLNLRPSIHRTDLHTDHILVPVLGLKVAHTLGLDIPRVPHYAVDEVISLDVEARLAVLHNRGRILLYAFVNAVDFACYAEAG